MQWSASYIEECTCELSPQKLEPRQSFQMALFLQPPPFTALNLWEAFHRCVPLNVLTNTSLMVICTQHTNWTQTVMWALCVITCWTITTGMATNITFINICNKQRKESLVKHLHTFHAKEALKFTPMCITSEYVIFWKCEILTCPKCWHKIWFNVKLIK